MKKSLYLVLAAVIMLLMGCSAANQRENELFALLTEDEKAYIEQHNNDDSAILIACETDNYPACFYNPKAAEFQGSAIDVLNKISELTGLKFKPGNEPNTSWTELLLNLENGEYSLITELMQTGSRQGRFLWPSEPYSSDNFALISRIDYPNVDINRIEDHKVGIIEDSAYADVFKEWFPNNTNTMVYTHNGDSFDALVKGEVNLLMMSEHLLLYATNYLERPYFKANIVFDQSTGSYFGFSKDEEILCSIINKSQRYVDTAGISNIWKRKGYDYRSELLRDMAPYVVAFSLLLAAALIGVLFLFLKNKRTNKNLEKLVLSRTNELMLQTSTLTTIFESIPDLVFCKGLDLKFTRCNRSFSEHFGSNEKDIIGKNDSDAFGFSDEQMETFNEIDRKIIRDCKPLVVEEIIPDRKSVV